MEEEDILPRPLREAIKFIAPSYPTQANIADGVLRCALADREFAQQFSHRIRLVFASENGVSCKIERRTGDDDAPCCKRNPAVSICAHEDCSELAFTIGIGYAAFVIPPSDQRIIVLCEGEPDQELFENIAERMIAIARAAANGAAPLDSLVQDDDDPPATPAV
jgi:hypothetical protein